jgi:NitT/TauT family transport system permease protein
LALAFLPFLFLCVAYVVSSEIQLAENSQDKLLPAFSTMGEALDAYAMKPDTRTGQFLLWSDTAASMTRLLTGLAISTSLALVVGIVVGLLPIARSAFAPAISVLSMVPPLPIVFIVMGLGEASKITLIVIGTSLKLTRDIVLRVEDVPREQLIKAQTLGASTTQIGKFSHGLSIP